MSETAMLIPIHHLPEDVIMDLLSRLPVKSLLRFRCVSKSWLNLISSPQFVKLHLNQSISSENQRILLSTPPLQSIDYIADGAITELDFPLRNPDSVVKILGSCDGLVCLFDGEYITVYNPTTRKFWELPKPPEILDAFPRTSYVFYGFGYDSFVNNYKVVKGGRNRFGDTKFVVFNLKGNCWRSSAGELSNSYSIGRESGVFVNGALYWQGTRGTGLDRVVVIVSFNMAHEVFEEMPLPDHYEEKFLVSGLGVLGGFLYLLSNYREVPIGVWVMKEYGVTVSWEKLIAIPRDMGDQYIEFLTPLCFLGNGELLLEINGLELVMYNAKENALRTVMIKDDWFAAALYRESLVLPNGL